MFFVFFLMYLQLSLSLEHGVGVSLINSVPEELLFATFSGVRVSVCSLPLCVVYGCVHTSTKTYPVQWVNYDSSLLSPVWLLLDCNLVVTLATQCHTLLLGRA